jgi:hypothetical protein
MHNFLEIVDEAKNGNIIFENEYGVRIFHNTSKFEQFFINIIANHSIELILF